MKKNNCYIAIKIFEIAIGFLVFVWGAWLLSTNSELDLYKQMFIFLHKGAWSAVMILLGIFEVYASISDIFKLRRLGVFLCMFFFSLINGFFLMNQEMSNSFIPIFLIWFVALCGIVYIQLGRCGNGE